MGLFGRLKGSRKKEDDNYKLPVSRSKLSPKPKVSVLPWKSLQRRRIASFGLVITFLILLYRYGINLPMANSSGSSLNRINYSTRPATYQTTTLEDEEYYDYDFEPIDSAVVNKFSDGEASYLLTEYGSSALSAEEEEKYDMEISMVMGSTVEEYELHKFAGTPNGAENKEHILLCVPLRDAEKVLPLMFKHLMNVTYPHELIDLAFLVSDCSEGDLTLDALIAFSRHLQNGTLSQVFADMDADASAQGNKGTEKLYLKYMDQNYLKRVEQAFSRPFHKDYDKPFRSVQIFQKDFGQAIGQGFSDRHAVKVQGTRRKLMARARNWLTANALKPYHSWVYWRDADVELCPGSVIQDLMSKGYDVIVPNVWRPLPSFLNGEQPYDLNSWVESNEALQLAKTLDEDDVIVEGYAEYPTWRFHLAYSRDPHGNPNEVMDLDGVGGVSILAKAELFRRGVQFPAFTFENHAETEAFGKMAKKMGYRVGGLPHYTLWHIYEPSDDDLKDIAEKERENRREES